VLSLATVVATLLRFPARACVVLACLASVLCAASIASAQPSVQPQTRVWDFSFAQPLNVWLDADASPRTHLENQSSSLEPASVSPHAARALPKLFSTAETQGLKNLFGTGRKGAEEALKRVGQGARELPEGVTRETLGRYKQQVIDKGLQDIPVQSERLRIIEELLK
jgi:hypothetical protein